MSRPKDGVPQRQPTPRIARRGFLTASGAGVFTIGASRSVSGQQASASTGPIPQPNRAEDAAFMQRAFDMREAAIDLGDQGYGAVLVRGGVIVGQSWSRVILDHDPTAHAEMATIRDAAHRLQNRNLSGTILFSSSRPCPMCEAAAYWAGISQMIHGRNLQDAGSPRLCR